MTADTRPRVAMTKHDGACGGAAPVGQTVVFVGKRGEPVEDLRHRVYGLLKRSMPDENPLAWQEEEGAS